MKSINNMFRISNESLQKLKTVRVRYAVRYEMQKFNYALFVINKANKRVVQADYLNGFLTDAAIRILDNKKALKCLSEVKVKTDRVYISLTAHKKLIIKKAKNINKFVLVLVNDDSFEIVVHRDGKYFKKFIAENVSDFKLLVDKVLQETMYPEQQFSVTFFSCSIFVQYLLAYANNPLFSG